MRPILITQILWICPLWGELTLTAGKDSLEVTDKGRLITEFRTDRQVPCLYPLVGPAGTSLTRHFPFKENIRGEKSDHPHHLSFWFTHGSVNGHDFWHEKTGEPPSRIVFKSFGKITKDSFTANLSWEHDGSALLNEKRTYQFSKEKKVFVIDFTSRLSALTAVIFGDTKEGSMGIRLTPSLRLRGEVAKGAIENSEGQQNAEVWGKRAEWVAYHGPDAEGNPTVVSLMDHPENLRHPTWWHARDYGLLAANPFGQHDFEKKKNQPQLGDFTLEKGTSFTQRYRLILQHGHFSADDLKQHFIQFSKP